MTDKNILEQTAFFKMNFSSKTNFFLLIKN